MDTLAADAYLLNLERIATPKERLLLFKAGPIESEVLATARKWRFDDAPVVDDEGRLIGVIPVAHVEHLQKARKVIDSNDPKIFTHTINDREPLLEFLDQIAAHRAVVILDTDEQHDPEWFALVTISDLNRHGFRAYLYPIFARLESDLAKLIDLTYEDPWKWIPWTLEYNRPNIIGRWMLDQRKNVDTGPLTACMFTDLMAILVQSKELLRLLGHDADDLKSLSRSFGDLRNDVMHPVRALVYDQKTVIKLRKRLEALLAFIAKVDRGVEIVEQRASRSVRFMP